MSRFTATKLILLGLAILVIALAWQNRELKLENQFLWQRIATPYVGMWVPEVNVETLTGSRLSVGGSNTRYQVLYFFSPSCQYCLASLPLIKTLNINIANNPHVQLIGVSQSNENEALSYVQQNNLDFAVTATTIQRTLSLFRARAVPLILVVDSGGRVRHFHKGTLSTQEEVDAILTVLQDTDVQKYANIK